MVLDEPIPHSTLQHVPAPQTQVVEKIVDVPELHTVEKVMQVISSCDPAAGASPSNPKGWEGCCSSTPSDSQQRHCAE